MTPHEYIKTIYLGDRSCKCISICSWDRRVVIQVDCVSRIRASSGQWEFYTDEDIEDGNIVFSDVEGIRFEPPGPIPNDAIDHLTVNGPGEDGRYEFEFAAEAVAGNGASEMVNIRLTASSIHLESPAKPGVVIE